jgi:hypothetical protein
MISSMPKGQELEGGSNLQMKSFVKGDPSPFQDLDYKTTSVYELTDFTFRTPLEKMDVFNELLRIPQPCEMWILPVTEPTTALLHELPKGKAYEKTASLFALLSSVKETMERDRTFMVADKQVCGELIPIFKKLGFTLTEKNPEELKSIQLS